MTDLMTITTTTTLTGCGAGGEFYSWHRAAMEGTVSELEYLLGTSHFLLYNTSVYSWSALTTSVIFDRFEAAQMLLERGALVNHQDNSLSTPLHEAAYWGHSDMVRLLLDRDADPFLADSQGHLPLHLVPSPASRVKAMLQVKYQKQRGGSHR